MTESTRDDDTRTDPDDTSAYGDVSGLQVQLRCVSRDGNIVLRDVDLRIAMPGITIVMGDNGAGKTSLLLAIAGVDSPSLVAEGCVDLDGGAGPLQSDAPRFAWLPQSARLECGRTLRDTLAGLGATAPIDRWLRERDLAELVPQLNAPVEALSRSERRVAAVLAALESPAPVILADEATAGLDPLHRNAVLHRLAELATTRIVLLATDNPRDAAVLGGTTLLLADGIVGEQAPTERFLSAPATGAGARFVASHLAPAAPRPAPRSIESPVWWVIPGLLGGMSRPGVVDSAENDFASLASVGVRIVICLEETLTTSREIATANGIALYHQPIADMSPPLLSQAMGIVRIVDDAIANGAGCVLHCRGGLGRTGTVLACVLVWLGDSAAHAVSHVRREQPHAIQTPEQLSFVTDFADHVTGERR